MREKKQRCPQCGARNRERSACRICGRVLPANDTSSSYVDLVEIELRNWNALSADPVYVVSAPSQPARAAARQHLA